jgi:hypothetical protein
VLVYYAYCKYPVKKWVFTNILATLPGKDTFRRINKVISYAILLQIPDEIKNCLDGLFRIRGETTDVEN